MCKERYVNPYTDFGFKRLFGSAKNKEFLISFLNSLFNEPDKIVDITYKNVEQHGYSADDRSAVYDLYCTTSTGSHIIVEMQRGRQRYFKDRTIYYSTFPMIEAAQKGDWDYQLPKIYTVAILDFTMQEYADSPQFKHVVKLTDQTTGEVFYEKLVYYYLEMPKYNIDIEEIADDDYFNIWLYIIKNLHYLDEVPKKVRSEMFLRFFRRAEIMAFTKQEREAYEASLKSLRDYKNSLDTSREEGFSLGREEGISLGREEGISLGIATVAKNLKEMGWDAAMIAEATGLDVGQVLDL